MSVESGTTEETDAKGQSSEVQAGRQGAVNVLVFPTQTAANLALSSGRAQVSMADSPVAAYQVKQSHGTFKLTGQTYGTAPYGLALPKKSGLAPAVLAALKADGPERHVHDRSSRKWGVQSRARSRPRR